jgi:hypothetical protein
VDPVPDPLLFFLVVPGIEPGPANVYRKNFFPLTVFYFNIKPNYLHSFSNSEAYP